MTPERYRKIRNLFEAVMERAVEARPRSLVEASMGDEDLRSEVEGL
jgi:hypothetical protein